MRTGRNFVFAAVMAIGVGAQAADQPQWGEAFTRNMVSDETGLPATFDVETGTNVKWSASLGGNAYGTPVIAGGKVLVGANNESPRDPRLQGDYGVLLCLNERDGSLDWQLAVPRTETDDDYLDWPLIAMCSAPTVDGRRVYTVTNRFEVVCLDLDGQRNGNDGVFQDEGQHMALSTEPPYEVTEQSADILWRVHLPEAVGMYPHDAAHTSILLDGRYLYLNSCNGVDNTHKVIPRPEAPTLIVLDKETGELVAQDGENIGPRIFHAAWSPPALGTIGGVRQLVFGGPDAICYGFKALPQDLPAGPVRTLERVWQFDCDPAAPKENLAEYLGNRKVSPSVIESMPVVQGDRVYVTAGGDVWWGKEQSWLKCLDAAKGGAELWSYPIDTHCCSTPSVANGLVVVGDGRGMVHCVDAETGTAYWTHDMKGEIWSSALTADGKIYIGSRGKEFCVFAASKEKQLLSTVKLDAPMSATPVAANGVLYVSSLDTLYAVAM